MSAERGLSSWARVGLTLTLAAAAASCSKAPQFGESQSADSPELSAEAQLLADQIQGDLGLAFREQTDEAMRRYQAGSPIELGLGSAASGRAVRLEFDTRDRNMSALFGPQAGNSDEPDPAEPLAIESTHIEKGETDLGPYIGLERIRVVLEDGSFVILDIDISPVNGDRESFSYDGPAGMSVAELEEALGQIKRAIAEAAFAHA
jgi:hypothetical protein